MHLNLHRYDYSWDDYNKLQRYVFIQISNAVVFSARVSALITKTMFLRTHNSINIFDANYFLASLFYSLIRVTNNAILDLSVTVSRLAIFYMQRDYNFYLALAYTILAFILKILFSFVDVFLWTGLIHYVIDYSPEPER